MILRGKQARFVEEYLVDLNATQAAIRAGYSPRTAKQIGQETLMKPAVQVAVTTAIQRRSARTEVTQDRVIAELATIGFSNVTDYRIDERGEISLQPGAPPAAMQAVATIKKRTRIGAEGEVSIDTELRLWDKVAALRTLAPHVGLSTEKQDVKTTVDVTCRLVAHLEAALEAEYGHRNRLSPGD